MWTPVRCDLCGEPALETLGRRSNTVRGRTHDFEMRFIDAVCPSCGFVCAAERPDEAFLTAYYQDAHIGHRGGELHFDAEARAGAVARHVPAGGRVIEAGANDGAFTAILRERGFDAFGFDPVEAEEASSVAKGFVGSASHAPTPGQADAVAAYYVLEHVIDPRAWLDQLSALIRPGGVLLLEVPDYEGHPEDSLNVEHLLHFTAESLSRLVRLCGLEPVESGAGTVSYGQRLIARKTDAARPVGIDPGAADRARDAYRRAGAARAARQDAARRAAALAEAIADGPHTPVYLWGANEYAERAAPLLAKTFKTVQALDKSPSKAGTTFPGLSSPVAHPDSCASVYGAIFLACSPNWNAQIAQELTARAIPALAVIDAVTGERL